MDRIMLITNSGAGTHDEAAVAEALTILRRTADVQVVATSNHEELDDALDARDGRDVVVAGGDGSLHTVVASLHRRGELAGPKIGLIPLGTGNDFARGAQIPLTSAEAAEVVIGGRTALVDMLLDDQDGIVVNAVHVGVGAEAGREAKPWKSRLGKLGYVVGAVKAGFKSEGHHLVVIADGELLADGHRRVLQVGIGNGSHIGGGTELAPQADPTDGAVDVVVSFSVAPLQRFLYGIHLKRGTHEERHDVHTVRARHVSMEGDPFWCNADGELAGPITSRAWRLSPQAFSMRLPASDPQQSQQSGQPAD